MMFFDTFLYYTFFASIVLFYGIGINRVAEIGITKFYDIIYYIKASISILTSAVLSWLLTQYILVPLNITEIYPLIALLIFICINSFLEALVRLTTGISTTEFVISFLIILLSISESSTIFNSIIICFSSYITLIFLIPFSITFKKRVCFNGQFLDEKYYSLFFMFLSILIIIMSTWDIGWLNAEVMK